VFPPANVTDTFFGTLVADPYRALENEKDPQVAAWMRAHADHAQRTLENLQGYGALKARVAELDGAVSARIGAVQRMRDGSIFFMRRDRLENSFKLVRRWPDGKERVLVDPASFQKATGQPHAIDYFSPSPDSKLVAVGISSGGSEMASLYVMDGATGKQLGAPIDRARYSNPSWREDGKSFF